jgi:acyl carrier protein
MTDIQSVIRNPQSAIHKPWGHYANSPLQGMLARKLAPQLRAFLQEKLPEYMVPSAFVLLDALPLSPNGKIDRRALLAPDQTRPELVEPFVAPRNPLEEVVAGIWAEVLGLEQVGIHDHFLELGGHSLLATQIMSRLQDIFPLELPLRYLFESPTVAGLAERIEAAGRDAQLDVIKAAQILLRITQLSDDEAKTMLARRSESMSL